MIDLMDNLVARWERFAGKPYAKPTNKPSGLVIRNTVSQAQDTLYRLKLGRERQRWIAVVDRLRPVQPAGPPQSLGELCIELAQDSWCRSNMGSPLRRIWINTNLENSVFPILPRMVATTRDIQELREVMYHKHKYPKEERLYRLIDAVRNA